MLVKPALLVVIVLVLQTATAWWCTGHMTIAQIALENLNSDVKSQVETIISELSQMGPFNQIPNFVEAACWADDLKRNVPEMKNWHFLNIPYDPTNFPIAKSPFNPENVGVEIAQFSDSLKWTKDNSNQWEVSFALANLVHFYGDIHQPLHVTEMFSSQFPNGDYGGNLFMINVNGNTQDLHGYWDAICNQFVTDPTRPLSSSGKEKIQNLAALYMSTYNFSDAQMNVYNSTVMADEGFNLAVQYAYANLVPGSTLSQTYYQNCQYVAEMRVTLAGYRLANQLNYLLKSSTTKKLSAAHINKKIVEMHADFTHHVAKKRMEFHGKKTAQLKK
jgi:hypothetical protein